MSAKGGAFEREISKKLSLWWSEGKRDDIFWRSSQSGGRATFRGKKGKDTFGSHGDIAALDPIGAPLIKLFCFELKTGKSHGAPEDLIYRKMPNGKSKFEKTLAQANASTKAAKAGWWILICRKLGGRVMIYFPSDFSPEISNISWCRLRAGTPFIRYRVATKEFGVMTFYGCDFDHFLNAFPSSEIMEMVEDKLKQKGTRR